MNRAPAPTACELSAVMIVFNGMKTIARALDCLAFCDEIVVIDDCSTDGTWEYLQTRSGIRCEQRRHVTMASQREYATSLANGRWILTIDDDEYVTAELAKAIREEIRKPDAPDGFFLIWKSNFQKTLRGFCWDKHPRLIRAGASRWIPTDHLHSPLDLSGLKMGMIARGFVDHEPLASVAAALRKSINKSIILSTQERARGKRSNVLRLVGSTTARFLKFYFRHGGWRFGAEGFVMASAAAFEAFTKHAFLIERAVDTPEELQDGGPGSFPAGVRLSTADYRQGDHTEPV
jgi:glycosyltransferase involved in cell wall biosynthesis